MNADVVPNDLTISSEEIIWRRVRDAIYDDNLKRMRPSSADFLQDGPDTPLSVYIASEAVSAQVVMQGGKEKYLAALPLVFVRDLGLGVMRDASCGGPGHALIFGRKTRSTQSKMAKGSVWVEPYSPQTAVEPTSGAH